MAILNTPTLLTGLPSELATSAFQHSDSGETVARSLANTLGKAPDGHALGHRRGTDPIRVLAEARPNKMTHGIEVILQDELGNFHNVPYGVPAEGFHGPKGSFDGVRHLESNM